MSETAPQSAAVTAPTVEELEAELAERRVHLSTTIDELITRVSPAEIARREVESVRLRIMAVTHTPDGEVRSELVAGGARRRLGAAHRRGAPAPLPRLTRSTDRSRRR